MAQCRLENGPTTPDLSSAILCPMETETKSCFAETGARASAEMGLQGVRNALSNSCRIRIISKTVIRGAGLAIFRHKPLISKAFRRGGHSQNGILRPDDVFVAFKNGILRAHEGFVPFQNAIFGPHEGFVGAKNGIFGLHEDFATSENGILGAHEDFVPFQNGIFRPHEGVATS